MLNIIKIKTKKELKAFIKFPNKLYKDSEYYVPFMFLDEKRMLSLDRQGFENINQMFLAYKDKKIVGRIGVIINFKENENKEERIARFTRFDCIEDFEVAKALFSIAEDFAMQNGCNTIHGPLGFNDLDREGLLVEGYDKLATFVTLYNYPYYKDYIEKLGYTKSVDWIEFRIKNEKPDERILKIANHVQKRNNLREIADIPFKKIAQNYAYKAFEVVNNAYKDLYGFTQITKEEVDDLVSTFSVIGNSRYISMLVDENDEIAGFALAFPCVAESMNKCGGKIFTRHIFKLLKQVKKPKTIEMALIAVADKYKNKGINALMISRIMKNCIEDGVEFAETNPELENNIHVQGQWDTFTKEQHKRRRCYIKTLN